MVDKALKPAIKEAIRYNELGTASPYRLSFARLGKSGASFGVFQSDTNVSLSARTRLEKILRQTGVNAAAVARIMRAISRPCPDGNPLSRADTGTVNTALQSCVGQGMVDAIDGALFGVVLDELQSCLEAAAAAHLSISAVAQLYIALWVNMSGEPSSLKHWLVGATVNKVGSPSPPAVTEVDITEYLTATKYFRLHPRNFAHMRDAVQAAAPLMPAHPDPVSDGRQASPVHRPAVPFLIPNSTNRRVIMQNPIAQHVMNVQICLAPEYPNAELSTQQTQVALDFALVDGEHTITSPLAKVGTVASGASPDLMASITFWYRFDAATNTLTFCSSELVSEDATFLTMAPSGSGQFRKQNAYINDDQELASKVQWAYATPLSAGLQPALQETVRRANDLVIATAKSRGFTVIVRTPVPDMPAEDYKQFSAVYYQGKFLEFFGPEKTYTSEHQVVPLDSIWYGEIYLNSQDYFANVIGSTNDPKVAGKSWIQLWQGQFGTANTCTSYGITGFTCSGPLLGGHVVLGKVATNVLQGSDKVFIMPICTGHNSNDNVYMAPLKYLNGIALHNYLQ